MSLGLAFKAFFKAWSHPKEAQEFIDGPKQQIESVDHSHLRLLTLLQQGGRLVDFLKEDISTYSDAQVGAAVRKIHEECNKSLEEFVTIRPVMEENEGATVKVPMGYNPSTVKVVGKVKGDGPYTGVLVHKGWKAHKRSLPKKMGDHQSEVICPAEVEIR